MNNDRKTFFFDMFEDCYVVEGKKYLDNATVEDVCIDRASGTMKLNLLFAEHAPQSLIEYLQFTIAAEYGFSNVQINANMPDLPKKEKEKSEKKFQSKVILGKAIKGTAIPMKDITLDTGNVIISGDVFRIDNREFRGGMCRMNFDITDYTGSLRVSKYMTAEESKTLFPLINEKMTLTVQGTVSIDRFSNDIFIEARNIITAEKKKRVDNAKDKRVELHLHTRFSTMDGLTEIKDAVAQAAAWGHKAIAVTDHGIAQAFPDAYNAGKKNGVKILYGVEAYYVNDYDDRICVHGSQNIALDGEFVAFDIETTGLKVEKDAITEIGAVICRNGKLCETFNTFVDPQMHISAEITHLTGIKDSDVAGAPKLKEALEAFLDFVGDRPLVAHNADFDMGFISAGCDKYNIPCNYTYLDTLVMAQNLLPELKRYKLDIVANHLGLPEFNHHRASDDASTAALMLCRFLDMLKEKNINELKEINPYMETIRGVGAPRRESRHMIILAKDKTGLRNMYKLISLGHLKYFKRTPIIPKRELIAHREGLLIGSACEAGEIMRAIIGNKSWAEIKRLAKFYDFLEIQPICNNEFMLYNGTVSSIEELREFNRKVIRLGEELGKPVVATGDVHFLHPEHEAYRRILLAAKKFSDADRPLPLYYKTTDEMLDEFSYLGEEKAYEVVIKNTNMIANMCEDIKLLPDGLFAPVIEGSADQLQELVYGKMKQLYGENPPEIVTNRVETELHDILGRNYDVIYMSAQKLVQKSLEAGYLVGSRGSVGSSIVAFMAGITEVNSLPAHYRCSNCFYTDFESGVGYGCGADMPDKCCPNCGAKLSKDGFDIPFETFLGFGGDKVPDIDLNFSGEYQAQAHKETINLFGADHVFRAGTIGTVAEKTAYGYVKNYLAERGITATKAEEDRLSLGCVGVKRTTGQHPGGLVVVPQSKEIYDFCPIQHPADSTDTDIITTHFEYHSMESNLLKLDELGHDDPTMIKMLEDLSGVNARNIALDDPDTMSIFKSPCVLGLPDDDPIIGKTGSIAIPEFGTPFTREMLSDTKPEKFDTLVRLSGFSHGTDVWLGNAKDLILSGTANINEVIGCRDDIMLYLISKGMEDKPAFKIMEAVRKGRGLTPEQETAMEQCGVPDWYIGSCKKIKYLFPKAHAVAYVTMAFRIAWFKVHRPLDFYCTYFTIRAKVFDAAIMAMGIDKVRAKMSEISNKPDATAAEKDMYTVLEVCYEFYMRGFHFEPVDIYESDAVKFKECTDALRPPFTAIPGLGESAAYDIIKNRTGKDFVSIDDFSLACPKVSKSHIEQLKALGAMRGLPDTSQISFF